MNDDPVPVRRGRQREAARNDARILQAAREVFIADPDAPIAAVAVRAGVGIGALYRRYGSKEELLRQLSAAGLRQYTALVEAALAAGDDPAAAFATFMQEALYADTHSLTLHLAGRFAPTEDLWRDGDRAARLTAELLARMQDAGVLRPEIVVGDVTMIFEQLAAVRVGDASRTQQLRRRYLALFLAALRPGEDAAPLPGPAPEWPEISARFAPGVRD
ncbi:MAG: helix-turn-helix domain-containing protein [Thermomicrobiales bacterium]